MLRQPLFDSLLYHTKNCQGTTTLFFERRESGLLYHTKNCQGTTTITLDTSEYEKLYHTKNCQGTTTNFTSSFIGLILYHTKNCQGTTTIDDGISGRSATIPYQELSGNYNRDRSGDIYRQIIPYQELSGNYNSRGLNLYKPQNYTIPRTVREGEQAFAE